MLVGRSVMTQVSKSKQKRSFRSDAALELISKAAESKVGNIVLYKYPTFSGSFSALFARLFHLKANLPCLILPFSSVAPFRVEDLYSEGLERCYLLDFIGPKAFAVKLSRRLMCEVICFDHRKSVLSNIPSEEECPENLKIHVDVEKSSSSAVYEHFSARLSELKAEGEDASLLDQNDKDRVEMILKYIEDGDLCRWSLPDIKAFNIGLSGWRSKLNCINNPYMYEQLLEISTLNLISKGKLNMASRQDAACKCLNKVFKLQLGRGLYGECLGVRADGNSHLTDEIGKLLSERSAATGLRPIGAVIYMQRNNLKMCLRSIDNRTDTSEVAKAYGGGGSSSSSSFTIRMDEYNAWLSVNQEHV